MSGGVFPLRDADLEDPVSSPPGRFRWPGSQRLALAFCGSVDLNPRSRVQTLSKRDALALAECRPDRIIKSQVSHHDDAHGRCAPSSPPRLEYDQRFRRTTAEGELQESRPSPFAKIVRRSNPGRAT
ncbi:uncharacterized protein TRIVIDRAFT_221672 [Trichoderma virens Gv29-8]|uniref:Uncharacterized protein n=1 Tax=Hypocrea virens (strain Gv29-8 / FGSC 10586) TaxID=413071 RepID=G9MTP2_HYPVG|nr:uncharacterized protein TRIVIDRAFT_221672 [Trichoderma virens Gv29-8]EHK22393.1 hypothetical protein TRIVIDRAFT_221672 [Trichoderma virens Gv29-8]UKZ47432.1 hypothetical protein TrVGV298_001650 [Trichoderma virens]